MARPTKEESIIRKLEAAKLSINKKASEAMEDMYDIIENLARDAKASAATRMSAAKYVIETGEVYLTEQGDDAPEKVKADDFTAPLIATTFSESKSKH